MAGNSYRVTSREAKAMMTSNAFAVMCEKHAQKGLRAFRNHVNARGGTGTMGKRAYVEKSKGYDGRAAARIVVPSSGGGNPISAEFGTGRSAAVAGLTAALRAMEGRG